MPLAKMFVSSILEFWGLSEDIPWLFVLWSQELYDWCFAQAFKRSKDFTAILETVLGAEQAGAAKRPAQSNSSPPTQRKKTRKNCPFAIQERRAEMGAKTVQVIFLSIIRICKAITRIVQPSHAVPAGTQQFTVTISTKITGIQYCKMKFATSNNI